MIHFLDCSQQDTGYITKRLVEYNHSQVPKTQESSFVPVNKKLVDGEGNLIAGCLAAIYGWNAMCIDILWVDEQHRKSGLGKALLGEMEAIAAENNCTLIHLDTFDFQAKEFYLKCGYEVFGVLEDCPEGHCRYYLKKRLDR